MERRQSPRFECAARFHIRVLGSKTWEPAELLGVSREGMTLSCAHTLQPGDRFEIGRGIDHGAVWAVVRHVSSRDSHCVVGAERERAVAAR